MPSFVKALMSTIAFALLAGWSLHRDSPQGMLRETAEGCLSVTHGFVSLYVAVLGAAGGMGLVVAITAYLASELAIFAPRRTGLRLLARSCMLFTLGAALAALMAVPMRGMLPLEPPPVNACRS